MVMINFDSDFKMCHPKFIFDARLYVVKVVLNLHFKINFSPEIILLQNSKSLVIFKVGIASFSRLLSIQLSEKWALDNSSDYFGSYTWNVGMKFFKRDLYNINEEIPFFPINDIYAFTMTNSINSVLLAIYKRILNRIQKIEISQGTCYGNFS